MRGVFLLQVRTQTVGCVSGRKKFHIAYDVTYSNENKHQSVSCVDLYSVYMGRGLVLYIACLRCQGIVSLG